MSTSADKASDRGGQPIPVHQPGAPSMHDLLIQEVLKRRELGYNRYGTILQAGNGRDALQDALDEAIDLCVYLMQLLAERGSLVDDAPGRKASLPLAAQYLHQALHLPEDIHIVGASYEHPGCPDLGNVILQLEGFADDTFPSERVAAIFHEEWNVKTGQRDTIFDGWESVD